MSGGARTELWRRKGGVTLLGFTLRPRKILAEAVIHLPLLLCAVTMLFPLVWLASSSLKHPGKQFAFPPQIIPNPIYWQNYSELFRLAPMGRFLLNSTKIAVLSTIGVCLSSSLAAFAFARMRFRGSRALFAILLSTMMIPGQVTVIPTFVIMRYLGWIDNHAALIVPSFFGAAFSVFLLRQFYLTIPMDLAESARIDGANIFQIFSYIYLPLSKPAMATLGIFTFMWSWNNLLGPLIYVSELKQMTLTVGLSFFQNQYGGKWTLMMAGAVVSILPILLVFFFAQKYFIQGIAMTGIKR